MPRRKRVDAIVFFDANLPRLRNGVLENFLSKINFSIRLLNLPVGFRGLSDDKVLLWAIRYIKKRNIHKKNLPERLFFFVTKDRNFANDSNFQEITSRELGETNARLKIITVPAQQNDKRHLNKRQILIFIAEKLNKLLSS